MRLQQFGEVVCFEIPEQWRQQRIPCFSTGLGYCDLEMNYACCIYDKTVYESCLEKIVQNLIMEDQKQLRGFSLDQVKDIIIGRLFSRICAKRVEGSVQLEGKEYFLYQHAFFHLGRVVIFNVIGKKEKGVKQFQTIYKNIIGSFECIGEK